MRTINNLVYPTGFAELDDLVPLNFFYDQKELFQLCHGHIEMDRTFFLLMRILDSRLDAENPNIIILNQVEFMVFTAFGESPDTTYAFDKTDGQPAIFAVDGTADAEYHNIPLNNFQVNLMTLDKDIEIKNAENEKFKDLKVFTYTEPIILDAASQRLHFKIFIDGEDSSLYGNKGSLAKKTCQVTGGKGFYTG